MPSKETVPPEWSALPDWVKEELLQRPDDIVDFRIEMQILVDHGADISSVWRLLELHRHAIRNSGAVHALLKLLREVRVGLDPGRHRTDLDRHSICKDIQRNIRGLSKQLDRLATGAPFAITATNANHRGEEESTMVRQGAAISLSTPEGLYPAGIASSLALTAWELVQEHVSRPFQLTQEEILADLDGVPVPAHIKKRVVTSLELLHDEIEPKVTEIFMDPRVFIGALAASAKAWSKEFGWNKSGAIWHIGATLKCWFGSNKHTAAAALATAILGEEVSRDSVKGIMSRRAHSTAN